jgi:hypothetical protein
MGQMAITFEDTAQAEEILELARYVNAEAQKSLVEDGVLFIAKYPQNREKIVDTCTIRVICP